MILVLTVLALDGWRWDEKLALSAALMAIGALAWAFAYTSAEGALRAQRFAFRRAGEVLVLVAAYSVVQVWI